MLNLYTLVGPSWSLYCPGPIPKHVKYFHQNKQNRKEMSISHVLELNVIVHPTFKSNSTNDKPNKGSNPM